MSIERGMAGNSQVLELGQGCRSRTIQFQDVITVAYSHTIVQAFSLNSCKNAFMLVVVVVRH